MPVGYAPPAVALPCSAAGGECPATCRNADHSLARAGRAADRAQAARYQRQRAAAQAGSADFRSAQGHSATAGATPGGGDARSAGSRRCRPAVAERQSGCARGGSGAAVAAPGRDRGRSDVTRRVRDRAQQPEPNPATLRHLRHRPRDPLGQRRSRQPPGADGVRRHLRLLRRARPAVAIQRAVPQPGPRPVARHPRGRRRAEQPVLRLAGLGAGPVQAGAQQHPQGRPRDRHHSDRPRSRSGAPST